MTSEQQKVRDRLANNAQRWSSLTDAQRAGWTSLGANMTRTDTLGSTYSLTGFQAYVSVNQNILSYGGTQVDDAPALALPNAPATVTLTVGA